eukprot:CAMPEP_0206442456 /NCGR_PEP_ID=MMETSP0324_2-20121206/13832_1 /ASSEMBLY_ACC=CAM_ASM_000836 /TAXON_ID=2866 /ORGANISM="Crypthecodinium cohnii, Strain Seligo" /LENGTH=871 /DNA_ID=CAMNT_0053910301 /DNA_START=54 /DNA_END=2669 /DNA_ORIENTATION=-
MGAKKHEASHAPPSEGQLPVEASTPSNKMSIWVPPALYAALLYMAFVLHGTVPEVRPAVTPLEQGFSAARTRPVIQDLVDCGLKYVGSPANEECAVNAVLAHVEVATKDATTDVEVQVQSASGHFYLDFIGGLTNIYRNLTNVVVRVKGKQADPSSSSSSSCALLVSSHFDSAIGSPAASDANAEIGIMVELLRRWAKLPLPLDVIFNFNGGEEMLLPAAHGFVTSHSWSKDICAVVNLESTGSGGREVLFQTGPANRWLVEAYARHVERPHLSSVLQVLFQTGIIPGDTDYRVYRDFGSIPGVDFAVLANDYVYHTSRDDMAHLDFRSIQRYGDTALQLAEGIAEKLDAGPLSETAAKEESAVFFDIAGVFTVVYSAPLALRVHLTSSVLIFSWLFHQGGFAPLQVGLRVALAGIGGLLTSLGVAGVVSFSSGALASSSTPALSFLLYASATTLGFFGALDRLGFEKFSQQEVVRGSIALTTLVSTFSSLWSRTVIGSYVPFVVSIIPCLADILRTLVLPSTLGDIVFLISFLLPWQLISQLYVLAVELLCALTMRSGTSVPGELVVAGIQGLLVACIAIVSANFLVVLPRRPVMNAMAVTLALGLIIACSTFPYSYDRPKRIYLQDTARTGFVWDLSKESGTPPAAFSISSGVWTVSMDWNNVDTMAEHSEVGLPLQSKYVDESIGLYGEMPYPFPIKPFLKGGVFSTGERPRLPNALELRLDKVPSIGSGGSSHVHVSVSGGPQIFMAIGPRSAVKRWSLGYEHDKSSTLESHMQKVDSNLPNELPPLRNDCDCLWLMFNEGGRDPTRGRAEAFNLTLDVTENNFRIDAWSTHLSSTSDRIEAYKARAPSWAAVMGWVSEVQVHKIQL